ncbi:MAG: HAMP domain-containing sensor histidine kinase [Pseudomonadota bacterium]
MFLALVAFLIMTFVGLWRISGAFDQVQQPDFFQEHLIAQEAETEIARAARMILAKQTIDRTARTELAATIERAVQPLLALHKQHKAALEAPSGPAWRSPAPLLPAAERQPVVEIPDDLRGQLMALLGDAERLRAAPLGLASLQDDLPALLAELDAVASGLKAFSAQLFRSKQMSNREASMAIGSAQTSFEWLFGVTIVLTLILVIVPMAEIRYFRNAVDRTAADLQRAESASQAKSRFLTMMNHELRTPMNGVMGLLALARQTGLNPRQERLLDQAERAGRKMNELLGDILDYSELQGETLRVVIVSAELPELANRLTTELRDICGGRGKEVDLALSPDAPVAVLTDAERLCQAARHIMRYLVDTVDASALEVEIRHRGGKLEVAMHCETAPLDGPGWQPEAVFAGEPSGHDRFATDAIGPAIARGLIARMGGVIDLNRHRDRRVDLILRVPAELAPIAIPLARVETNSATSAALAFAMLDRAGWRIWRSGDADTPVRLVVAELGGQNEAAMAARLRVQHPAAWLVGVGRPEQPALFDATCPSLTDPNGFRAAVEGKGRLSKVAS